jgi:hypothetical protein
LLCKQEQIQNGQAAKSTDRRHWREMSVCTHAPPITRAADYCPGSIITRNTITDESTTHILSGLHFERDVHLTELYIDGFQLFCSLDLGIECLVG